MKSKVNKFTVATRITGDLKETLEQEAQDNGLSFCKYLEEILLNRDSSFTDFEDDDYEDIEHLKDERAFLISRIEELENALALANDEDTEIEEETFPVEEDDIYTGNLSDLKDDLEQVETEYVELKEVYESSVSNNQLIIADLEQQIIDLKEEAEKFKATEEPPPNQFLIDNDALQFLQKKHPNLSKEAIIKSALDCSATNESKWLTVYSFTDYVTRSKSFINYQNN